MRRIKQIEKILEQSSIEWKWDCGEYSYWRSWDVVALRDKFGNWHKVFFCKSKIKNGSACFVPMKYLKSDYFHALLNQLKDAIKLLKEGEMGEFKLYENGYINRYLKLQDIIELSCMKK